VTSNPDWNGAALTLEVDDYATMAQTPDGSMIFAFQNMSKLNNKGTLELTSGGNPPEQFDAPQLVRQPNVLIRNWRANNLNILNTSANQRTPIWIEAFGPGIGPDPQPLPLGQGLQIAQNQALQGDTKASQMQLKLQFNSTDFALFGIIGGPADSSGNNAYAIALNSPSGTTGPPTTNPPPVGYYATSGGNNYTFKFNWGSATLYVAYFGSGRIVSLPALPGGEPELPTLTLLPF
jgi:hypothetical protein